MEEMFIARDENEVVFIELDSWVVSNSGEIT